MRVDVVTDAAALAAIEEAWADLFGRVVAAPPFVSPAWLLPWWQVFAPGALRTVAVWDGDRLAALAPLYREDGRFGRRLLPLGIGLSDMLDVLVDPARAADGGTALMRGIAEAARDCDAWSAEEAPPDAAVLTLSDPPAWRSELGDHSACPTLRLPGTGRIGDAVPKRQRRKWRMAEHRAAARGCEIAVTTRGRFDAELAHLFRLHGLRWESRGEAGVLAEDAVRRFHRAAAPGLGAAGLLRMTTLRLGGSVAGACHVLGRGRTFYAYLGGFDPAFAYESPGTLLIGEAIEHAAREGATAFSFLRGQEDYKYAWGARDRLNRRRVFAPVS